MNPVIAKMVHFAIIVNGFYPFAIVAKSSILNMGVPGSTSALE